VQQTQKLKCAETVGVVRNHEDGPNRGWYRDCKTKGWNPWSGEGAAAVIPDAGRFTRVNSKTGGCSDASRLA